jgi:hypothetical protein
MRHLICACLGERRAAGLRADYGSSVAITRARGEIAIRFRRVGRITLTHWRGRLNFAKRGFQELRRPVQPELRGADFKRPVASVRSALENLDQIKVPVFSPPTGLLQSLLPFVLPTEAGRQSAPAYR